VICKTSKIALNSGEDPSLQQKGFISTIWTWLISTSVSCQFLFLNTRTCLQCGRILCEFETVRCREKLRSYFMCKIWDSTILGNIFIPMRKLVLDYATSSGTHPSHEMRPCSTWLWKREVYVYVVVCKYMFCECTQLMPALCLNCVHSDPGNITFSFFPSGVGLSTAPISGRLYQPHMIGEGDGGAIGGMKIDRGNRSTRRKPVPAPLCPPQIPCDTLLWSQHSFIFLGWGDTESTWYVGH
jgi:hypothetical protein